MEWLQDGKTGEPCHRARNTLRMHTPTPSPQDPLLPHQSLFLLVRLRVRSADSCAHRHHLRVTRVLARSTSDGNTIHSLVPSLRVFPPASFVFSRSVFKFLVIALVIPSTPAHRLKPFVFALLSLGPTRSHIRRNLASVHSDEFRAIMEYSNVYCSIFLATILYYFQRMLLLAFWVLYISPRLVLCSVA